MQVKSQYFIPLIKAVARDVFDKIHDRFSMYESLETDLAKAGGLDDNEKRYQKEKIAGMMTQLQQVRRSIVELKERDVH